MAKHSRVGEMQSLILMAIRSLEPEAYGVPIQLAVERVTGRPLNVGALYGSLHRLEDRGYLASLERAVASDTGRVRRSRYYALTDAGLRMLEDLEAAPAAEVRGPLGWVRRNA